MNEDTPVPDSSTSDRAIGEEGRGGKLGKTAGRADGGKSVMHTIDPKMMMAWSDVLAFGARKYHQRNFMVAPGMAWSRVYESLNRHLWQFWAGEWLDEESGLPHLAHVLCNIQFLWTYHEHPQYRFSDDRPSSVEYRGQKYADFEAQLKTAVDQQANEGPIFPMVPEIVELMSKYGKLPDIHAGLASASGNARGPRDGRGSGGFSEHNTLARVQDLQNFVTRKNGKEVVLDIRDLDNLINMVRGV